jgi:MFS family permease
MKGLVRQFRSFDHTTRLLVINQFTINIGFYMLMPYLATYLADDLGWAVWLVGVVLGARNLAQQGMFLLGGSLADRFGYKPLIVAGCVVRTGGFVLLGLVDSVAAVLIASAATGFAGALFNPAVRAYLAHTSGARRIEAFALFNSFYQAGIVLGPVIGLLLTNVAFRLTCLVAAGLFAALTVVQIRALPTGPATSTREGSLLADWRGVVANRRFLAFSLAMIGSYVLSFQVYLALPLWVRQIAPTETAGTVGVCVLFAVSGIIAVFGQVRLTASCRRWWQPSRCIVVGLGVMALSFAMPALGTFAGLDVAAESVAGFAAGMVPLVAGTALLALGTAIVFPFEMDTIVTLAGDRLLATHYGLYNTLCGIGIAIGNFGTGAVLDLAREHHLAWLPWLILTVIGLGCALAIRSMARSGHLNPSRVSTATNRDNPSSMATSWQHTRSRTTSTKAT